MKKIVSLFVLFVLSSFYQAQEYQIIYNFKYKRDSLSDNYKTEPFVLQIEKDISKFMLKTMVDRNEKMDANTKMFYNLPQEQVVSRNRQTNEFTNYDAQGMAYYQYPSQSAIDWKIETDTKSENNYQLQKATAKFGGRSWEAWFIKDIPLAEGPFKFYGLPGLIYEVKDSKNNFIYNLSEIKKLDTPFDTSNILESHFGTNPVKIDRKKYEKIILNDYSNPYAEYRSMKEGSWMIGVDKDRTIKTIKDLDLYAKEYQEQMKKNYNPVQLDQAIQFPK